MAAGSAREGVVSTPRDTPEAGSEPQRMPVSGKHADTATESFRRASLRRQMEALTAFRDALRAESDADYERFAPAMYRPTDALLHELMALEGVPPYPHPRIYEYDGGRLRAALSGVEPERREWEDADMTTALILIDQMDNDASISVPDRAAFLLNLLHSHGLVQLLTEEGYRAPSAPSAPAAMKGAIEGWAHEVLAGPLAAAPQSVEASESSEG